MKNELNALLAANHYHIPRIALNDRISVTKKGKKVYFKPNMSQFQNVFYRNMRKY